MQQPYTNSANPLANRGRKLMFFGLAYMFRISRFCVAIETLGLAATQEYGHGTDSN